MQIKTVKGKKLNHTRILTDSGVYWVFHTKKLKDGVEYWMLLVPIPESQCYIIERVLEI